MRPLLNALLFFPSRTILQTPGDAGLRHSDVRMRTTDGEQLHGWWIRHRAPVLGHYKAIPPALVPDAYPSLRLVDTLRAPLLVLHGEDDMIVPVEQGRALFDAAPEPKRLRVLGGVGHNDILSSAGRELAAEIAAWAREDLPPADELCDAGRSS